MSLFVDSISSGVSDLRILRFDNYPEDNVAATYGLTQMDLHGAAFPDFEYTSPRLL